MKARSAKAKGTRLEKWVEQELQSIGLLARRQPGSGIYSGFPHDVSFRIGEDEYIVECKARKEPPKTLERWRGQAHVLVIKHDYHEPSVYMTWKMFRELVGYGALDKE